MNNDSCYYYVWFLNCTANNLSLLANETLSSCKPFHKGKVVSKTFLLLVNFLPLFSQIILFCTATATMMYLYQ